MDLTSGKSSMLEIDMWACWQVCSWVSVHRKRSWSTPTLTDGRGKKEPAKETKTGGQRGENNWEGWCQEENVSGRRW